DGPEIPRLSSCAALAMRARKFIHQGPAMSSVLPAIAAMKPGDHYCGIFRTDEDQRTITIDFVRDGVARGEKMFYVVNVQSAEHIRASLARADIDAGALIDKGQLVILTAKDAYLKEGQFDPDKMVSLLARATEEALAEGYAALRATGEMTWALAGEPGSERL